MTDWLLDTLLWTALLIALVLLIRRPIARAFGPQVAYALWALPALRLLLPPIELPAWMAPAPALEDMPVDGMTDPSGESAIAPGNLSGIAPGGGSAPQFADISGSAMLEALTTLALALWAIGAAVFMYRRFAAYFRLREELLAPSSEVGRIDGVRLVETPHIEAPLAFGVTDRVIALPRGFLASPDRAARDLALAHEMAHHEGRDLLINVLVQPLFAMHWFNPLGHYGWLAMRRDQEAACDARVVASCPPEVRQAYADLIVSFAKGPELALAAPMACPVLGEKSIIHRLRSLNMSDTPRSRRLAGRALLCAGLVALPLTASITYAASDESVAAVQPPPAPPAPPAAPAPSDAVPVPPAPPAPPAPKRAERMQTIDPDRIEEREERRERWEERREVREERAEARAVALAVQHEKREKLRKTDADVKRAMDEMERSLAEAERTLEEVPHTIKSAMHSKDGVELRTVVKMKCDDSSAEVASTISQPDGSQVVWLCEQRIMAEAMKGLREARKAIEGNTRMPGEQREKVIKHLDRQIERWEDRAG